MPRGGAAFRPPRAVRGVAGGEPEAFCHGAPWPRPVPDDSCSSGPYRLAVVSPAGIPVLVADAADP
jgi:hypothetical protein